MIKRLRQLSVRWTPAALTLVRVVVGFVMAVHGLQKVSDFAGWEQSIRSMGVPAPGLFAALSAAAELAGGLGLMLGLLTLIAAFGVLVNMIVAITVVHAENGLLAQNGGFEYPLVLAAVALFFLVRGPGPISVDRMLFRRRRATAEPEPETSVGERAPA